MNHFIKKEEIETNKEIEFYDITERVIDIINESGFSKGHVTINALHTTVGIYLNEGEPRLLEDFKIYLNKKVPEKKGKYLHDNISKRDCPIDEPLNGHSHLKSAFYSNPSITLILHDKSLLLGQYQRILFAEFDGPCPRKHKEKRKYAVSIIGE